MNVVDSSGWLEYFADGANASFFAPAIEKPAMLVVLTISVYEVCKRVMQQRDHGAALQVMAVMRQGRIVELTETLAMSAAVLSLRHGLPMADSIMLATAQAADATLWTQDAGFEGLPGVRYVSTRS